MASVKRLPDLEDGWVTVSVRAPRETIAAFEAHANKCERTLDSLLTTALLRFIDEESEDNLFLPLHPDVVAFIAEGERSAREEPLLTTEEVFVKLGRSGASAEA